MIDICKMRRLAMRRWFSSGGSGSWKEWWDHVGAAPSDPVFGTTQAFLADPCPHKINLGVGAYRDDQGKPVVLQCVRDAAALLAGSEFMEYLPMGGSAALIEECVKLAYGEHSDVVKEKKFAAVQALSGTGACRLFAEFQRRFLPHSHTYIPMPSWNNHHSIWRDAEVPQRTFRYYHPQLKGINFPALMDDIKNAPDHSVFLLHACAHNPTGVDPSEEQWKEISHQFKVKSHFPFFDMAYQGFASGNLNRDAMAVHIFQEDGHLIGCAQSFAKNMGLYGQRVGCLSILCANAKQARVVKSQLEQIARPMYSNPPVYGALLVSTVLSNPDFKSLWVKEMKVMVDRIACMRSTLREILERMGSSNWEHITNQIGMFCYSGLTPQQVDRLTRDFHIYMTRDGRMSMAGVNTKNVEYVAKAINEIVGSK